ncbi:MAG: Zn-finger nucleic acid-binding protein [Candidatus Azotimanducaceae bacterium]
MDFRQTNRTNLPLRNGTTLVISKRTSVEIDYCFKSRVVELDHGDLDKIIDQLVSAAAPEYSTDNIPARASTFGN